MDISKFYSAYNVSYIQFISQFSKHAYLIPELTLRMKITSKFGIKVFKNTINAINDYISGNNVDTCISYFSTNKDLKIHCIESLATVAPYLFPRLFNKTCPRRG